MCGLHQGPPDTHPACNLLHALEAHGLHTWGTSEACPLPSASPKTSDVICVSLLPNTVIFMERHHVSLPET